ncbi:sarcosine oxidase subunit gamma [Roseobacter weihaiensis]|uniref:sarcosine oxidase subunit gamma n=1 Tax=Roseobacter weihaiensis TaxID=2763262 RepID=UPI001D0B52E6|nr:sarcosine oxidase subunit gamma [Roseobacter sp. H9]
MHDLAPLTALGHAAPWTDQIGGMAITERPQIALASVTARQGREPTCRQTLTTWLGDGPPPPGKALLRDPFSALWMGPDQWIVAADYDAHERLADELKAKLKQAASITEQTDAWVCFDVSGDRVVDLCERLCPAPARRMQTGDAQRTTVHQMGCFLVCLKQSEEMRFIGPRSSAGSLYHALVTAADAIV